MCSSDLEHRPDVEALLGKLTPGIETRHRGVRLAVSFSEQHPSTDTVAIDDAGKPFWYPRKYAPGTLSETSWTDASGNGTVYTYSTHFIGPSKAYKGDPPHIVALVDLDEGPRMMTILVKDEEGYPSLDPEDVKIGMKVKLVFDDVTDEITMPRFTPAG